MLKYNSGKKYNKNENYNSSTHYIVVVNDSCLTIESIDIISETSIVDNGRGSENIILESNINISDQSVLVNDTVSIYGLLDIIDFAIGTDGTLINANINISDAGFAIDSTGITGAFFVIDSNNILHPLGVLVTGDSRYELLPATRDYTDEVPGRHGEIDFGTEFKARPLELHVATKEGYSPLEKSHLQRLFAKYLDPTKGAKTLIFSDDVEKTYMVKYSGKIDLTNHPTWFQFVIPFKMSDPFIIGSFEKTLIGSGTLVNKGTFETGLIIEIAGPATNPSLTIGGEILSYNGTIPNGQKLIIDTEKETAKIGSSNAIGDYNGVFPLLYPGETNVVAGNNVTIRWRDKWI